MRYFGINRSKIYLKHKATLCICVTSCLRMYNVYAKAAPYSFVLQLGMRPMTRFFLQKIFWFYGTHSNPFAHSESYKPQLTSPFRENIVTISLHQQKMSIGSTFLKNKVWSKTSLKCDFFGMNKPIFMHSKIYDVNEKLLMFCCGIFDTCLSFGAEQKVFFHQELLFCFALFYQQNQIGRHLLLTPSFVIRQLLICTPNKISEKSKGKVRIKRQTS